MRYFLLNSGGSQKLTIKSKKYVAYSLCLILLCCSVFAGCKSQYRHLVRTSGDVNCIRQFSPAFSNNLYSAYVDVTKHHFSGILFFKQMPDSSMRIVFTNEIGVKFFDFAFTKNNEFIKYYVLAKMDKKVVVNALKNDLRLVLLKPDLANAKMQKDTKYTYVTTRDKSGNDHYITENCKKLVRIEKASKRKPVVVVQMLDYLNGVPDSIDVQHKNFKFHIALKRVER